MRQGAGHNSVLRVQGVLSGDLCRCKDLLHFLSAPELSGTNWQGWVVQFYAFRGVASLQSDRRFRNFRISARRDSDGQGTSYERLIVINTCTKIGVVPNRSFEDVSQAILFTSREREGFPRVSGNSLKQGLLQVQRSAWTSEKRSSAAPYPISTEAALQIVKLPHLSL
jgi:hypothetical protein